MTIHTHYRMWVPPFGHLRVYGYVLLTAAFRSLSRPSSAPSAKASALCSFLLNLLLVLFPICCVARLSLLSYILRYAPSHPSTCALHIEKSPAQLLIYYCVLSFFGDIDYPSHMFSYAFNRVLDIFSHWFDTLYSFL